MTSKPYRLTEVYYEIHKVGTSKKVIAIDPVTGIEITMVGAPGYTQNELKRLAARKLEYVINKKIKE